MNNTIELAKDYEFLNKSINIFKEKITTFKSLVIFYTTPFLFFGFGRYFYKEEYHAMFWGFLLVLFLVTAFAVTIILIEILSDERSFTFSKKRFYSKKLSFEEREKLEAIFRESFENILKNKQKVDLNKTLVERLETLEKTLYTKEYIQSLKDAISENSEHEQYLPTLEELAQNYNKSLKENNEKFDAVNNELLKANVTIFNDKKEEPLRILEQN
jgi:uncharacterized protein (DUF2132 family)